MEHKIMKTPTPTPTPTPAQATFDIDAKPESANLAELKKQILSESGKIDKSLKANRETIQNWLICVQSFKGRDVSELLGLIMDRADNWHGLNVSRLEKCIKHGLSAGKLSRKEDGWKVVCKPQDMASVEFAVTQDWFTFELDKEPKEIPLAEALALFVAKREKKGDTPADIAKALKAITG